MTDLNTSEPDAGDADVLVTDGDVMPGNIGATSLQVSSTNESTATPDADERRTGAENRPTVTSKSAAHRARVTNGSKILPTVSGNSVWARLLRDTRDAMVAHLGGEAVVSEPQRLAVRRVAAFEAELIYLEDKFAGLRHSGKEPEREDLILYNTLANGQRRFCESLGWQRVPRDLTPTLQSYLTTHAEPPANASSEATDSVSAEDAT